MLKSINPVKAGVTVRVIQSTLDLHWNIFETRLKGCQGRVGSWWALILGKPQSLQSTGESQLLHEHAGLYVPDVSQQVGLFTGKVYVPLIPFQGSLEYMPATHLIGDMHLTSFHQNIYLFSPISMSSLP